MTAGSAECGGHLGPALPLAEALERIRARVRPLSEVEVVERRSALGRVSAATVCS